jgi:hypothetical protein
MIDLRTFGGTALDFGITLSVGSWARGDPAFSLVGSVSARVQEQGCATLVKICFERDEPSNLFAISLSGCLPRSMASSERALGMPRLALCAGHRYMSAGFQDIRA